MNAPTLTAHQTAALRQFSANGTANPRRDGTRTSTVRILVAHGLIERMDVGAGWHRLTDAGRALLAALPTNAGGTT